MNIIGPRSVIENLLRMFPHRICIKHVLGILLQGLRYRIQVYKSNNFKIEKKGAKSKIIGVILGLFSMLITNP